MTHLQSCYFCGTTGALSEYEMPAGTDGSPPRITLCTRCHTKLTNVIAPVLDQFGDSSQSDGSEQVQLPSATDAADETAGDDGHQAAQPEVTFSSTGTDDASDEGASADDSRTGVDGPSDAAAESDVESSTENGSAEDDVETAEASEAAAATHERETTETETVDAPDDTEIDGTDGTVTDDVAATNESAETDEPTGAEAEAQHTTTPGDEDEFPAELERVYHKLLRFLRNREFPIPRAEAEAVAQSAYDLTEREASQVLQRAVDKGVLEERESELHRG